MTPPETARSNAALRDYALMGAGRDIRSLHKKYLEQMSWWKEQTKGDASKSQAQKPPTTSLPTLWGWSTTYEWQARVRRWDELQQEREERAFEAERDEWRKHRREAAQSAMGVASAALGILQKYKLKEQVGPTGKMYPPIELSKIDAKTVVAMLDQAAQMVRREYGDDTEKVDITSGGKAIAITEVRVHLKEGEG